MRRRRSSVVRVSPWRGWRRLGLPVPPGFHVTTAAYCRFVEANALQAVIAEATANAQPDDPASVEQASAAVRRLSGAATRRNQSPPRSTPPTPASARPSRRRRSRQWRCAHPLPQKTSLCSPSASTTATSMSAASPAWRGSLGHCTASGWQRRHRPRRPAAAVQLQEPGGSGRADHLRSRLGPRSSSGARGGAVR